ncbi:hypothetical protein C1O66_09410 [Paucibacter aquatile]|nr:hypothetical protein C1O66_09410 [Paucibacter aquatile]
MVARILDPRHARLLLPALGLASCLWPHGATLAMGLPRATPARFGPLKLISYYDYPPFVTSPQQGLSFELAGWLHMRAEGLIEGVELELLPRRRVDIQVRQAQWAGLVPWVSPAWFSSPDPAQAPIWSAAVMNDEDLVLSLKRQPFEFEGPASLRGHKLGGVYGHVYTDADPLVASGELQRLDSFTQEANLRMLLLGRVDLAFLSRSGLAWWRQRIPGFDELVHVAAQPRMRYQRHLMISRDLPETLRERLLQLAQTMGGDSQWREVMRRYGLLGQSAEWLNIA